MRQVECEGSDGRGRIRANAFEGEDVFISCGEYTVVFFVDEDSGGYKIPASAIITQTFPKFKDLLFGSNGQIMKGGKGQKEFFIVSPALLYPCLLKNYLTQPNLIGLFFPLPGHGPGIFPCMP